MSSSTNRDITFDMVLGNERRLCNHIQYFNAIASPSSLDDIHWTYLLKQALLTMHLNPDIYSEFWIFTV